MPHLRTLLQTWQKGISNKNIKRKAGSIEMISAPPAAETSSKPPKMRALNVAPSLSEMRQSLIWVSRRMGSVDLSTDDMGFSLCGNLHDKWKSKMDWYLDIEILKE